MRRIISLTVVAMFAIAAAGCQTNTQTGALAGGGIGAVVGGIIGHQFHNTGAGVAIGAATGAVTGAVVGNEVDKSEARNRALIEQRMGRPMPGAVSVDDAVAMSRAGVDQQVIIDHIHAVGVYRPLTTDDIIYLRNNGVSNRVVQTLQHAPIASPPPAVAYDAPPPVVVADPYYDHPHPWFYRRPPPPGIGVTIVP